MNRTQTKDAGMSTETLPRTEHVIGLSTIEGIDMESEVPCVGLCRGEGCPASRGADVIVATHRENRRYPSCHPCLADFASIPLTYCGSTDIVEPGHVHYRIVEVLR